MKKIFMLGFTILCFGISGHAEMKIADLDKLVAEGKGEKKTDGVYLLHDKVVINGKELPKTEFGALYSSRNLEYFLLRDYIKTPKRANTARLFDKKGNLIWDLNNLGGFSRAIISDNGLVALFYGVIGTTSGVLIYDKSGRRIKAVLKGDSISGDVIESLFEDEAQFAKSSDMLFVLAHFAEKQLVLLGIDETGEIKYFQKVTGSPTKDVDNWYARIYFNPKLNQVLIDSSGIGEAPPMLSYWSFSQKIIFSNKTDNDEKIINASFADNDDILLLIKKKDGVKMVRRLSLTGIRKGEKSDVKKMDAQEQRVLNEKLVKVGSLNWGRE